MCEHKLLLVVWNLRVQNLHHIKHCLDENSDFSRHFHSRIISSILLPVVT